MIQSKPDLLVLPFTVLIVGTSLHLTFEQTLYMLSRGKRASLQIERSYPGAAHAIGWTIFRRTTWAYRYENEPLFRFEGGARRYIRKVYAIHYSFTSDDGMTYSHLHL